MDFFPLNEIRDRFLPVFDNIIECLDFVSLLKLRRVNTSFYNMINPEKHFERILREILSSYHNFFEQFLIDVQQLVFPGADKRDFDEIYSNTKDVNLDINKPFAKFRLDKDRYFGIFIRVFTEFPLHSLKFCSHSAIEPYIAYKIIQISNAPWGGISVCIDLLSGRYIVYQDLFDHLSKNEYTSFVQVIMELLSDYISFAQYINQSDDEKAKRICNNLSDGLFQV